MKARIGSFAGALVALAAACSGARAGDGDEFPLTPDAAQGEGSDGPNEPSDDAPSAVSDGPAATADAAPPPAIVVNEVAAAGSPDDWIEVKNLSASAVDLGGLYLTDDLAGAPTKGQFMAGTTLEAGGYLMLAVNDVWPGFKLGSDEEITLVAADGATVIDRADWNAGESPAGQSYGRMPDGEGSFATLATPTPGSPNTP